jgi:tetratricopeptide (TPR) repeat protein
MGWAIGLAATVSLLSGRNLPMDRDEDFLPAAPPPSTATGAVGADGPDPVWGTMDLTATDLTATDVPVTDGSMTGLTVTDYESRLAQANQILDRQPDHPDAWHQRGVALQHLQRLEAALISLNRAVELQPEKAAVWVDRGLTLRRLGRQQAALTNFDQAIALDAHHAPAWLQRGEILQATGRYRAALTSYTQAVEVDPTLGPAWRNRAKLLWQTQRRPEALASYQHWTVCQPNLAASWMSLAGALCWLDRYDEAVESYERALALAPTPQLWAAHGWATRRTGQLEAAIASYDRALQTDPDNPQLWYDRGLTLRQAGRYEGAIANFQRALELRPDFYAATRSKLFTLGKSGGLGRYCFSQNPLERDQREADLRNVFDGLVKTQLPALVVIGLMVWSSMGALHSFGNQGLALAVAGLFGVIAAIGSWLEEGRR